MSDRPQAAYIEIMERTDDPDPAVIIPNEVRINGIPLLMPEGESVTVHEIGLSSNDVVKVTLTLFARRVLIDAEPK